MSTKTESIKQFLLAKNVPMADSYTSAMECQVLVFQGEGEPVDGEWKGIKYRAWTDGVQQWKSFRIPFNAKINPTFEDTEMRWDLAAHCDAIGMTGWNWVTRTSTWVAFDFDSICGHSAKHGSKLEASELEAVRQAASQIPWVTVRRSTGGHGLHLYVYLNNIPTANHTEHAALARAILGKMSAMTNFDFNTAVDICGGNMWVWARKMHPTLGFQLLKQGTVLHDVPSNWMEHVKVVNGTKRKAIPGLAIDKEDSFAELCSQRITIPRDDEHMKHIKWLDDNNLYWSWNQDLNLLITHTANLKLLHTHFKCEGPYDTISEGKEQSDYNCFCFPAAKGSWDIRRFSVGVQEHNFWEQDGSGWTRIAFNRPPDLKAVSKVNGGLESPKREEYVYPSTKKAIEAATALGAVISPIPEFAQDWPAKLRYHKDGRLIFEIKWEKKQHVLPDWLEEKGWYVRIFNIRQRNNTEKETRNFDDFIRHLVTTDNSDGGWVIKTDNTWREEPVSNVKMALKSLGEKEIDSIAGNCVMLPWSLVNRPFEREYLPDRQWNRHAAQLKVVPSQNDKLNYPTWSKILNHIGHSLNASVADNAWCKMNSILTGADYLKLWISSVIQKPFEPLPYLFLYGPQNSGKSILHESLDLLISNGIVRAELALTNPQSFNGEIETGVICIVEELDLRGNKVAYNRIKDWVTSKKLSIHKKFVTPYLALNTTHWIHLSNEVQNVPVFPGDTRITIIYVPELSPVEMIPKFKLLSMLEKEASDFLAAICNIELPEPNDRLAIPILETQDKYELSKSNMNSVERFFFEECSTSPGTLITFNELYQCFVDWCEPDEVAMWTKNKLARELPKQFPKGRSSKHSNKVCVGNILPNKVNEVLEKNPNSEYIGVGEQIKLVAK